MRTTVDLPAPVHARARRLAGRQGRSLSAIVAQATAVGLDRLNDEPLEIEISSVSGSPTFSLGFSVDDGLVAKMIEEP